jgi:Glycine zipper
VLVCHTIEQLTLSCLLRFKGYRGNMKQHRFIVGWLSSTILILTLTATLIATPYLAFATESGDNYLYLVKGQSPAQQAQDRHKHLCAVGQTGVDTGETVAQAAVSTPVPTTPYRRPQRHVGRGAARGAALGAVGGAIAGDPAKGAAAGAAMGGAAGTFRRRDAKRQQSMPQQPMQPYPQ